MHLTSSKTFLLIDEPEGMVHFTDFRVLSASRLSVTSKKNLISSPLLQGIWKKKFRMELNK